MKRYRVELSPEAATHVRAIQAWWIENRTKSPTLFARELRAAIRQVRRSPGAGKPYRTRARSLRRLLLPRTGYHLYYGTDDATRLVRIFAVWHGARGKGPKLGP